MRSSSFFRRSAVGALVLPLLMSCADELPTATGGDLFPGGSRPITVELLLEPEQFLLTSAQYTDFTNPAAAGFHVVARDYEGALSARALARFTGFPDSVTYTINGAATTVTDFTYEPGQVVTTVTPLASVSAPTHLRLWALAQAWDTAGVNWNTAAGRTSPTPWQTPGGTRGELLAETSWAPGDTTAAADSVYFQVDAATVSRMAAAGYHGLIVTSETEGSRLQLSRLSLRTSVRPAAHPDTTITLIFTGGPQTTIFTPPPALTSDVFRVGGLTGDRAVLEVNLAQQVPGCASPATTPGCPMVPLSEVTINQASLILTPIHTPGGLRPLQAPPTRIRRVLEPELGRFAPLGELVFADTLPVARFGAAGGEPLALDLTRAVSVFTANGVDRLTLAVLTEPEGAAFGYLYFTDRPRMRIVYTLPLRPTFP